MALIKTFIDAQGVQLTHSLSRSFSRRGAVGVSKCLSFQRSIVNTDKFWVFMFKSHEMQVAVMVVLALSVMILYCWKTNSHVAGFRAGFRSGFSGSIWSRFRKNLESKSSICFFMMLYILRGRCGT